MTTQAARARSILDRTTPAEPDQPAPWYAGSVAATGHPVPREGKINRIGALNGPGPELRYSARVVVEHLREVHRRFVEKIDTRNPPESDEDRRPHARVLLIDERHQRWIVDPRDGLARATKEQDTEAWIRAHAVGDQQAVVISCAPVGSVRYAWYREDTHQPREARHNHRETS